ncbi:DNA polymerase-3 subunit chi [Sphingomonas jejuensis]|uniref:DNA polymerase-3 subunit chi n=1 Tax=Sphingomonas jejuensis TaxID=904715 RepID=A0ABX0XJJ7_9SPHN|nr:DNA polymerase-3 subunit chi [Sphingomonas jejuensis]
MTDGGGRLLVVADDDGDRARIDAALWRVPGPAFLAHGQAGEGDAANQPILLSAAVDPANGARNIVLADGRWRDEALDFERCFHLFDEAATPAARDAWRALAARDGVERRFWKQDEAGRWTQAA